MDAVSIISFLSVAIVLTVMPGPDNLFVLTRSIVQGSRAGISTSLGLCTGLLVHIAATTVGISAIIYQSALAFMIVKYIGAAYLLYLSYKAFRSKGMNLRVKKLETQDNMTLYRRGIVMNLLNPKVSLFFLAFLPQFINNKIGYTSIQMFVYGMTFLIQGLIIFILISIFAGQMNALLHKSRLIANKLHLLESLILAFIGLKIAFSEK